MYKTIIYIIPNNRWDENEFNCGRTFGGLRPGIGDFNAREDQTCITKNNFKCWQGTGCIGLRAVCDGVKDCADGSDERVCDNWNSHCDQFTEFRVIKNLFIDPSKKIFFVIIINSLKN